MESLNLEVTPTSQEGTLQLATSDRSPIPWILPTQTLYSMNLWGALGCLNCPRLENEGQKPQLLERLPPERALFDIRTLRPRLTQESIKAIKEEGGSLRVVCPLINLKNTSKELRTQNPPCRQRQEITVSYGFRPLDPSSNG